MTFPRIASGVILLSASIISSGLLFGQTEATISGVLADPSGAGVPAASLTLTNQDTAVVVQTQKSDASGNFSFQAVPAPGTYAIGVQVTGFARLEQKDIVLTAGERRAVGTLTLAVGNTSESVTVQADATPVQTESAERSGDIDTMKFGRFSRADCSSMGC